MEELEGLSSGVAVEGVGELVERRRDLQAHVEDLALALKADILRPLDHAREVAGGLDVGTDTEVAGLALDERVLLWMSLMSLRSGERGQRTLGAFLEEVPAGLAAAGAGAVFLPDLGGYGH